MHVRIIKGPLTDKRKAMCYAYLAECYHRMKAEKEKKESTEKKGA
ncbi:hypothetical protein FTV88_2865 [Heliorestis convoluta]|uniref:Uncharacterized protein n=1 Tax=Heliorestis convoluta TaxID=356322 RepID=A0A5Q2N0U2_9FIRM|nr:hypothetical protein FTV88_2865 [Heliorestis convoluta]